MDANDFNIFLKFLNDTSSYLKYNESLLSEKINSLGIDFNGNVTTELDLVKWIERNVYTDYESAVSLADKIIDFYPDMWYNACYLSNANAANQVRSVYERISDLINDFPFLIEKLNVNSDAENRLKNINNIINEKMTSHIGEIIEDGISGLKESFIGIINDFKSGDIREIIRIPDDAKVAVDNAVVTAVSDFSFFIMIKKLIKNSLFYSDMNLAKDMLLDIIKAQKISWEFETPLVIYLGPGLTATYKISVEGGLDPQIEHEKVLAIVDGHLKVIDEKVSFSFESLKAGINKEGNISVETSSEISDNTSISTELSYDKEKNSIIISLAVETQITDGTTVKTAIELEKDLDSNWSYEWEPIPVEEYEEVYVFSDEAIEAARQTIEKLKAINTVPHYVNKSYWEKFAEWSFDRYNDIVSGLEWAGEQLNEITTWTSEKLSGFTAWTSEKWNEFTVWTSEQWNKFTAWTAEQWDNFIEWGTGALEDIKVFAINAGNTISDIMDEMYDISNEIASGFSDNEEVVATVAIIILIAIVLAPK